MLRNGGRKVETLRRLPLLAGLSRRALAEIARRADEVDVPAGWVLAREGEIGRQFFVLASGEAVVRTHGGAAARLRPGDFFGEGALVAGGRLDASVVTAARSRLLVLTEREFRGLLREHPQVELRVLRALAERLGRSPAGRLPAAAGGP